ncbi:CP11A protein, partial [Sitta europaea]|nr:CP11A protein [Sitta europaea]
ADRCIQSACRELRGRSAQGHHLGILGNLIVHAKLPLEEIRASVTEMMAGGVDTVRDRDQGPQGTGGRTGWGWVGLGEGPGEGGRRRRRRCSGGEEEEEEMLRCAQVSPWPYCVRRLHPVAVTLQRYTTHEVILQEYRIP